MAKISLGIGFFFLLIVSASTVNPLSPFFRHQVHDSIVWEDQGRPLNFDPELSLLFRRTGLSYHISNKLKEDEGIDVTPCNLHYVNYKLGRLNRADDQDENQNQYIYYLIKLIIADGEAKGQNWSALVRRINHSDLLIVDHVSRLV